MQTLLAFLAVNTEIRQNKIEIDVILDLQVFMKFGQIQGEKKIDRRHTPRIPRINFFSTPKVGQINKNFSIEGLGSILGHTVIDSENLLPKWWTTSSRPYIDLLLIQTYS